MKIHLYYILLLYLCFIHLTFGISRKPNTLLRERNLIYHLNHLNIKNNLHFNSLDLHPSTSIKRRLLDGEDEKKLIKNLGITTLDIEEIEKVDSSLLIANLDLFIKYLKGLNKNDIVSVITSIHDEVIKEDIKGFYNLVMQLDDTMTKLFKVLKLMKIDFDFFKKVKNEMKEYISKEENSRFFNHLLSMVLGDKKSIEDIQKIIFYLLPMTNIKFRKKITISILESKIDIIPTLIEEYNDILFHIILSLESSDQIEIVDTLTKRVPKYIVFHLDPILDIVFQDNNDSTQITLLQILMKNSLSDLPESHNIIISEKNEKNILELLETLKVPSKEILIFLIQVYPEFIKRKLNYIFDYLFRITGEDQVIILSSFAKCSPEIIKSNNDKIYDIIKSMEYMNQKEILENISKNAPDFIILNINNLLKIISKMDDYTQKMELIESMATTNLINLLKKSKVVVKDDNIDEIWNILKGMDEPSASIMILFVTVGKNKINNNNEIEKELKHILNRMDISNYEKVMDTISQDLPENILKTSENDKDCAICLEKIPSDVQFQWCKNDHGTNGFHSRCINDRSNTKRLCALCRGGLINKKE